MIHLATEHSATLLFEQPLSVVQHNNNSHTAWSCKDVARRPTSCVVSKQGTSAAFEGTRTPACSLVLKLARLEEE